MSDHMIANYRANNEKEIAALLVGRRIVEAEKGKFAFPGSDSDYYSRPADGRLLLDDGTTLFLRGNDGCGGCSSGWYELESIAKVDNAITGVRVEAKPGGDDLGSYDGTYRIFVMAEATEINVAEFTGSDGNGYYGTGFELFVVRSATGDPSEQEKA